MNSSPVFDIRIFVDKRLDERELRTAFRFIADQVGGGGVIDGGGLWNIAQVPRAKLGIETQTAMGQAVAESDLFTAHQRVLNENVRLATLIADERDMHKTAMARLGGT